MRALSVLALGALLTCPAWAEGPREWQKRALAAQAWLDDNVPLSQVLWIGTHNSYNSKADGYVDWNQSLSIKEQLRQGVREVVFDVHWYNKELRLCHGDGKHRGCVAEDRRFKAGLRDIRDFLQSNPEEVILLKIEGVFGNHENRFHKEIENNLGLDRLLKPTDLYTGVNGCKYLDQLITREEIRAKRRNVILVVEPNKDLCNKEKFYKIAFEGVHHTAVDLSDKKFVKVKSVGQCNGLDARVRHQEILRAFDSRTKNKIGSGGGGITLDGRLIDDFLACGLNIFEMYNYRGDESDMKHRFIWSWDNVGGEPKRDGGGCAELNPETNRYRVVDCAERQRAACVKLGTPWHWCVSDQAVAPGEADAQCRATCGAGYVFGAPWSKRELNKLMVARDAKAAGEKIALNLKRSGARWIRLPALK